MVRSRWNGPRIVMLLATATLAVIARSLHAQSSSDWNVVGQIGGPSRGLAIQGSRAMVGVGMRLVLVDVSNLSDLREVGATAPFPHFVEDVAVSGTTAYVAAGTAGLRIIDVSNAQLPVEKGAWDSSGYSRGVAVDGNIAYVADGPFGLRLVDVSKPSAPVEVGAAYVTYDAHDVVVQGNYAFVAAAGAGLLIADVADPAHPVEIGTLTTGYAVGVAVNGRTAFVADAWQGIVTVDVTDPRRPLRQAAYKTPGWAFGVTVAGTMLYVADSYRGLRVLDVADPVHLREVAFSESAGSHAESVAVDGGTAYVADRNYGLRAINLSAGPELPILGAWEPLSAVTGVATADQYAYVASSGLTVIDISDAARPKQVGRSRVNGAAIDVMVRGSLAYLTTKAEGAALAIFDVSDPRIPVPIGFVAVFTGQPRGFDVAGDHVYVAAEDGLEIVNVSNPRAPVRSGFLRTKERELDPGTAVGVVVSGGIAYVALESGGVATVDVSNPANPIRLATFTPQPSGTINDVAISGNYAFVADGGFGLRVLDVTDPSRPLPVGSLRTDGPGPLRIARNGSSLYLARGDAGVLAVDISNPAQPRAIGSSRTPGFSHRVALSVGKVFVADGPNALLILDPPAGATAAGGVAYADLRPAADPVASRWDFMTRYPAPETASAAVAPAAAAPGSCIVTTADDSGPGTLRACLQNAGAGTVITFDPAVFPPSAPGSIRLASGLPNLPGGVTIDGSDAGVIVDGSGAKPAGGGNTLHGLGLSADDIVVRGLQIVGFPGNGIQIHGRRNLIGGDRSKGRGPAGQANVLSGNRDAGIMISGDGGPATDNVIAGNFIGTNADGTKAAGNGKMGVWVQRAKNNRVGGTDAADRNVISGNAFGIIVSGGSTSNLIVGNYVGTDVSGALPLPNQCCGIYVANGAFGNAFRGNLISGDDGAGVQIDDAGSNYNSLTGNRIGTDASGMRANPNRGNGVVVYETTAFTRIGGTQPEERNIISGNAGYGVSIQSSSGNVILGNFIGVDAGGHKPLGNAFVGINITRSPNVLGGATLAESNVIGANTWGGVQVTGNYSVVLGNFIGTDRDGASDLGNTGSGVSVRGVDSIVQGNVIAHGGGSGVVLNADGDGTIRRNSIHDNDSRGIETAGNPPAPIITTATRAIVTGTACGGCEVEIYSDSADEGRLFEGATVASSAGAFAFAADFLEGPNVTATATSKSRTSPFSAPVRLPPKPPRRRAVR